MLDHVVQQPGKRNRDRAARREVWQTLNQRFPAVFRNNLNRKQSYPLKVGIARDILERCPSIDPRHLNIVLGTFVNTEWYLRGLVAGRSRIDLDGVPGGSVTPDEASNAKEKIKNIWRRKNARKVSKPKPKRLGLADLKKAALARKAQEASRG